MKKFLFSMASILLIMLLFASCGKKQEVNVNLLENPSFESADGNKPDAWVLDRYDASGPSSDYGVFAFSDAPDGSNVLVLENLDANDARYYQEVEVEKNSYYKLSARVKTENIVSSTDSGANLSILGTYFSSDLVTDGEWTEITVYGKTDSKIKKAKIALRLGYYSAECSGKAYFDDVSFMRVESVPSSCSYSTISEFQTTAESSGSSNESARDKIVSSTEISVTFRAVLYFAILGAFFYFSYKDKSKLSKALVLLIIGLSVAIRFVASMLYTGFSVDINCFSSWGEFMVKYGPADFYSKVGFCDYPPLYMLVLGIIALITGDISLAEGSGVAFLKLPAVLCDGISAVLIYNIARKKLGERKAGIIAICYAFLPTAILNSAIWGQVDSILVVFMILTFWLIEEDKFGYGVFTYFIGLLFKPQAILFGPVMLLAMIREFQVIFAASDKKEKTRRLLYGFGGFLASVVLFVLLSVIMRGDGTPTWLIDKYTETLSSYNYATLSSFGFMGLLGGQWADATGASVFGISYSLLGNLLLYSVIAVSVALFVIASIKNKGIARPRCFYLIAAFLVAGAVTFSTRTHERYMFPVIAMLVLAYIAYNNLKLLKLALGYAVVNFINTGVVLYLYEALSNNSETKGNPYMLKNDVVMIIGSAITVILFVILAIVSFKLVLEVPEKKKAQAFAPVESEKAPITSNNALNKLMARRSFKLPKVTWKDIVICLLITAVYACVAFTNLGDTKAAQTIWETERASVYTVADMGEAVEIDSVKYKSASSTGTFAVSYSDDGVNFVNEASVTVLGRGVWYESSIKPFTARYIKITARTQVELNELAFFSGETRVLPKSVENTVSPVDQSRGDGANLFDGKYNESTASTPTTFWSDGGIYTVYFDGVRDIEEIYAYIGSGDDEATLAFSFRGEDGEWTEASQIFAYGTLNDWTTHGYLDYSLSSIATDSITVKNVNGSISVGELVFVDSDGNTVEVQNITAEDEQGTVEFEKCFDEPEAYIEMLKEQENPDNTWTIVSLSDFAIADFGEVKNIQRGTYYTSVCAGSFSVYFSTDGENWYEGTKNQNGTPTSVSTRKVEQGELYYWRNLPSDSDNYYELSARYVAICPNGSSTLRFIECGFFESKDAEAPIPIVNVITNSTGENGGENIFDEQELVPTRPSYMNSMYFDEIYHGRTAYESLNGMSIYEWTHPPLGKDMMSWSISIFGMTPFGWRFAGTLAGVLMVPAMYFIGLLMFRKTSWAAMLAGLISLDGMHYVQTRIATIDSYGVLWIICMFLFMYWYYSISFYNQKLWKTFIPLGLCGLCFGLGAASKWICLYAGAGLAVIFFITVFRRTSEYITARKCLASTSGEQKEYLEHIVRSYVPNLILTLAFCVLVFIIIPLVIYCASYYPYWNVEGETRKWYQIILENQKSMYTYHSQLEATHPFQSNWYTWPIIARPIFYYSGKQLSSGQMECISSFGNPAIWYMGLTATVLGVFIFARRLAKFPMAKTVSHKWRIFGSGDEMLADAQERDTRLLFFLILGVATNLLPWVGVSRCIFIYHYFATVPFIMMFTVYIFRNICRNNRRAGTIAAIAFMIFALVMFIMFKPIWTGTEVSKNYVNTYLRWFDSWVFGS